MNGGGGEGGSKLWLKREKINQEMCFESPCFHNFFYNNGKTLSHLKSRLSYLSSRWRVSSKISYKVLIYKSTFSSPDLWKVLMNQNWYQQLNTIFCASLSYCGKLNEGLLGMKPENGDLKVKLPTLQWVFLEKYLENYLFIFIRFEETSRTN